MSEPQRLFGTTLGLLPGVLLTAPAHSLEFDEAQLRSRGLDPAVAQYFKQAPRFAPGTQRVALRLNGQALGKVLARFDEQGQLCFDDALLRAAGLKRPSSKGSTEIPAGCHDFLQAYPNTEVELQPADESVALIVSHQALAKRQDGLGQYLQGGTAGLVNYEVYGAHHASPWGASQQVFASTELGFNAGNWAVRSRQTLSQAQGQVQGQWLYSYAQTSVPAHQALVQVGQVNVHNSVLTGLPITGAQWLPDNALNAGNRRPAAIEGTTQGLARVEVRQGQALVYSTLVPEGPFRLEDVQPINRQQDLDVSVHESSGEVRHFLVPIATFSAAASAPAGLGFAVGRARGYGGYATATPWVASLSHGFALGHDRTLGLGLLASDNGYASLGVTLDRQWSVDTGAALTLATAHTPADGDISASGTASLRHRLGERLSVSASLTQRSPGFRDLAQTLVGGPLARAAQRTQSMTLGGSHPVIGGYSLSYVQAFSGVSSRAISLGWNRAIGPVSLSARLERDISPALPGAAYDRYGARGRTGFYLSLSVPLGGGTRLGAHARDSGRGLQVGSSLSGRVGERLNYRMQASRSDEGARQTAADVGWQGTSARVSAGVHDSNTGMRTYTGQISGAAAWHAQGITLGPTALGDTFAIASVSDVAGARLDTPAGAVWTDHRGQALIANVPPYRQSEVRLATGTLPRNADVSSAVHSLMAGRGAVAYVDFNLQRARRLLLKVRMTSGLPPPKGSAVVSAQGQWITAVGANGALYLADATDVPPLYIQLEAGARCLVRFTAEAPTGEAYYETAEAQCVEEGVP